MADAAWKKLKDKVLDKVTAKRGKKRDVGDTSHKLLKRKELTVQRLSSEVSGKAQKYARIGPREFVPFTEDELTIEESRTLSVVVRGILLRKLVLLWFAIFSQESRVVPARPWSRYRI